MAKKANIKASVRSPRQETVIREFRKAFLREFYFSLDAFEGRAQLREDLGDQAWSLISSLIDLIPFGSVLKFAKVGVDITSKLITKTAQGTGDSLNDRRKKRQIKLIQALEQQLGTHELQSSQLASIVHSTSIYVASAFEQLINSESCHEDDLKPLATVLAKRSLNHLLAEDNEAKQDKLSVDNLLLGVFLGKSGFGPEGLRDNHLTPNINVEDVCRHCAIATPAENDEFKLAFYRYPGKDSKLGRVILPASIADAIMKERSDYTNETLDISEGKTKLDNWRTPQEYHTYFISASEIYHYLQVQDDIDAPVSLNEFVAQTLKVNKCQVVFSGTLEAKDKEKNLLDLSKLNLTDVNCSGATFRYCTGLKQITRTRFEGATFEDVEGENTQANGACFDNVRAKKVNFKGGYFQNASMRNAIFSEKCDLSEPRDNIGLDVLGASFSKDTKTGNNIRELCEAYTKQLADQQKLDKKLEEVTQTVSSMSTKVEFSAYQAKLADELKVSFAHVDGRIIKVEQGLERAQEERESMTEKIDKVKTQLEQKLDETPPEVRKSLNIVATDPDGQAAIFMTEMPSGTFEQNVGGAEKINKSTTEETMRLSESIDDINVKAPKYAAMSNLKIIGPLQAPPTSSVNELSEAYVYNSRQRNASSSSSSLDEEDASRPKSRGGPQKPSNN